MSSAVLLLAPLLAGAALLEDRGLSAPVRARVEVLDGSLRASTAFRVLDVSTRHLPRRELRSPAPSPAVEARGGEAPTVVFDAARLGELPRAEAAAQYVLALARAELAFPMAVVEAEQAAWQTTLRILVELAAEDADFSRALDLAYREADPHSAAEERARSSGPWALSEAPAVRPPASTLARAGLYLRLFEKEPAHFHKAVEDGTPWPAGATRLSEIEDLFALRGRDIAALKAPPAGPYVELGGRRYPAALARAAFRLRGTGEVERLRETLAAYDTAGVVELREAFARWRRGVR